MEGAETAKEQGSEVGASSFGAAPDDTTEESGTAVSGTVVDCCGRRALSGFEALRPTSDD